MTEKKSDDLFPDLSGIFDIDENEIPKVPIKRTESDIKRNTTKRPVRSSSRSVNERILTVDDRDRRAGRNTAAPVSARQRKRDVRTQQAKNRAIIILSAIIAVFVAIFAIKNSAEKSKMPSVGTAKAVFESIDRSYSSPAAILKNSNGTFAVLIDNDYSIHFLEKKQRADITASDGTVLNGEVEKIQEEPRDGIVFAKISKLLLKETPETPVYTVYLKVDDPDGKLKDSEKVNAKIYTKSVESTLTVPSEAINSDETQKYVWLYHPVKHVLSRQEVTVGITADGRTEILSGLSKGDTVAVSVSCPPKDLYNGIKVKTK